MQKMLFLKLWLPHLVTRMANGKETEIGGNSKIRGLVQLVPGPLP